MNAKDFGAFLAQTRKACGLTQADLAAQLHVTDKAVSRWERGVGLPDINTLEPLADALGLTLSDLMHCRDPQEAPLPNAEPTLEDFLTMLRRPHSIDWHSVRAALLCLSILLAVWGVCFHPRCSCRSLARPWQWRFPRRRLDAVSPDLSAASGAGVFLPEPLASL